jgi:hypothetical protein
MEFHENPTKSLEADTRSQTRADRHGLYIMHFLFCKKKKPEKNFFVQNQVIQYPSPRHCILNHDINYKNLLRLQNTQRKNLFFCCNIFHMLLFCI